MGGSSPPASRRRKFVSQKIIIWVVKILFVGASDRRRLPAMAIKMPAQTPASLRCSCGRTFLRTFSANIFREHFRLTFFAGGACPGIQFHLRKECRTAEIWILSTQTFGAGPVEIESVYTERMPRGRDDVEFFKLSHKIACHVRLHVT